MAGTMTPPFATSQGLARRDRNDMTRRRQQTAARLSRERARNARLALACYVLLAAGLASGLYFGWLPGAFSGRVSPADAASKRFAETRAGQVVFTSADGALCRELKFNNDTGRFSDGRTISCEARGDAEEPAPAAPGGRVLSLREGFTKR